MKSKKGRIIIITLCALFIALSVGIFMMTGVAPAHTAPTADDPDNSLQSADDPANTAEGDVTFPDVPAPAVTESTNQPGVPDRVVSTTSPTGDSQTAASSFDADTYTEPSAPDDGQAPDIAEPVSDNPENTSSEPGTVRLCLGGDTSIDSEFADAANKWGIDYPWKEVTEVFSGADLAIVNLETCVSERGTSEKRQGYGFRTPPEMLEGFVNAGIDMVNLANNHTRDFGYDALTDTFEYLSNYGIDYFGAGINKEQAEDLVVKTVNGVKIGFAGCNYVYLPDDCAADEDHAGINMVYKMSDERTLAFLEKVKEYDTQCDVLIVFMHAGTEEVFEVNSYQKNLARALVDNGVDIVVGAHPHTLQPIEFYNGKPIFYSIGNLIFWHIDDDIDGLTCIFDITVDKDGFKSLKLHPLFIKSYKVYYLERDAGKYASRYGQIIDLMNELCKPNGVEFTQDGVMVRLAQ